MKKVLTIGVILIICIMMSGCGDYTKDDLEKDLSNKIEDIESYNLTGKLKIINNEDTYEYSVEASYQEDSNYKVSLKNEMNNHEQIILKNSEGVFVLTPSLNKSFKFQSEWPFNGSQTYLLQSILKDIENDDRKELEKNDNGYILTTKVNYSNNQDLTYQKIYINDDLDILKVEVYTNEDLLQMEMTIDKIDYKASFKDDYFDLKSNMSHSEELSTESVSSIDEIIYPMYMPENTKLTSEETIQLDEESERVLLTFSGDKSFTIIQETYSPTDDMITIPVIGDPEILVPTIGAVSEDTISWSENGIEYLVISEDLSKNEMIKIANSLNVIPISK